VEAAGVIGAWFADGRIVWLILALVLVEAVLLIALRMRTGRDIRPLPLIANLAAGGLLMLAIRAALLDQPWIWVGLFMALALIAHLTDIASRFLARSET
jgi:hypothetical protein